LLACFGHSSVFTLTNLVKKTANKKTIDESLYLHRCESRRHFCSQKSSTLVFFSFIFSASGTAIRVWIEVTILQMKVQTVNDPLQCQRLSTKPTNFFFVLILERYTRGVMQVEVPRK